MAKGKKGAQKTGEANPGQGPQWTSDFSARPQLVRLAPSLLTKVLLVVFVGELAVMGVLGHLAVSWGWWVSLADAALLTLLIAPALYFLILQPTARFLARAAVLPAEEKFRAVVESVPDAVVVTNSEGRILLVNAQTERLFGHNRDELLGQSVDILAPDGFPAIPVEECGPHLPSLGVKPMDAGLDAVMRRKDGSEFPAEARIGAVKTGNSALRILAIRDITERKRAEAALHSSEERYRGLFEDSPISLWEEDFSQVKKHIDHLRASGVNDFEAYFKDHPEAVANCAALVKVLDVSRAALDMFEAPSKEALLEGLEAVFIRESYDSFRDELIAVSEGKTNFAVETIGRTLRGKIKNTTVKWSVVPGHQDTLGRVVVSSLDITEHKQAEEQLRATKESLETLVQTAPAAIISLDNQGTVLLWNRAAEEMLGWSSKEIIGRPLPILPADRREEYEALRDKYLRGDITRSLETRRRRKDGTVLDVNLSIAPLRDAGGNISGSMGILSDITERKEVEQQLQEAKKAAEKASQAKSEFLANMSHEIRTPINGIIGMTELALNTDLNREQREYLTSVRESAHSLLDIINDILDFSKIEARKLDLDLIDFQLPYAIEEAIKIMALRAHEKGLELACQVRPDLPPALVGDPGRLRQVLLNLVGNAIKFTERGEVVVRVEVESQTEEAVQLHFAVTDTGVGIPEEKQRLIFETFAQGDSSTRRKYGGTGLGLAICAQLVQMMGGRIWVESELGRGSTFHFTASFGRAQDQAPRLVPVKADTLRGMPVLVVDDNATNRRILEEMLAHWQMKPSLAEGGQAALAALERAKEEGKPFPLILLDVNMPEIDGFALVERIKQDPGLAGATIMMLTSVGQRGDAVRCRELGVAAYLTKPIQQSELFHAILQALGGTVPAEERSPLVTRHTLGESRRSLRVLLAEDNPVNQRVAARLLEKRGHSVVVVGNGRQALAALEKDSFDVVLMDIQMPEMDGFEATTAIREKEKGTGKHISIVALTAHAMKEDRERCLAAGMDSYIPKPFTPPQLFEAVEGSLPSLLEEEDGPRPGRRHEDEAIDRAALLRRVGGDRKLLNEVVDIFFEDCPGQLAQVRQALARGDSRALERAAHALKGLVGTFSQKGAFIAARTLEDMGRQGTLAEAWDTCGALEEEIARLQRDLTALGREETS